MNYQEENNYPKAFAATGLILAVVIALCYFIVFHNPPVQEDGTGGILVNYGTTDEGMGKDIMSTEEPSVAPKANHAQPTKVTETKPTDEKPQDDNSDKKVVTQENEDAAAVATNSKKKSQSVATQPAKPVSKPVVNQNALYKGSTANKGTGAGDGTTNTPGNQGSKNGSTLSNNYGQGGSGGGLNMPNWSFVDPPDVKNVNRVPGIVVVDFTIDQNGNVIEVHSNRQKTKAELNLVQNCLDAIKASRFKSSSSATGNQKGEMSFVFKVD
ncbi:energy transducer TonB [Mucilaginibacter sp.]|uniref:energy transducer TonB n=1 Tax=Mucilaginibacter sp. TaxID=1882438 RepID=UPI003D1000C6